MPVVIGGVQPVAAEPPKTSRLPSWLTSFLPIFLTAALTWGGSYLTTTQGQAVHSALTDQKIQSLTDQISEMKTILQDGVKSRYTADMAASDRAASANLISSILTVNNDQSREIATLREFKAWVEATLKMTP